MSFVKTALEDGIGIVSINNPPVNALSSAVFMDVYNAIKEFKQTARVIILTGEGQNFAAGADVKEIVKIETAEQGEAMCVKAHAISDEIWKSDIPVIAAVNGYCLGGGCELVMCCHIRIATDKARFAQPEIKIGIIPGLGGTQRLPRYIGAPKAIELLLTGDMISAAEAKALGLVNLVVPEPELKRQAVGLAKKIAVHSKVAVAEILRAVREGIEQPLDAAMKMEAKAFGRMMPTADKKEGVQAFIDKRAPKFTDR
jgi:enoyl-CoA hydratase/carnithine racemase